MAVWVQRVACGAHSCSACTTPKVNNGARHAFARIEHHYKFGCMWKSLLSHLLTDGDDEIQTLEASMMTARKHPQPHAAFRRYVLRMSMLAKCHVSIKADIAQLSGELCCPSCMHAKHIAPASVAP
jgi:hypothetical protein